MRRPGGAAPAVVLLLWLAALTFAFHGRGGHGLLVRRGGSVPVERDRPAASLARKMLLAVESGSLDTSSAAGPPQPQPQDQQWHHHHHHRHRRGHHHRQRHHRLHTSRWNWQRIPPAAAPGDGGEEADPRYGVEKRLVPTGPNPLHH
ncbi:hypothetical protein ZWY2020_005603 [Hordeum vulgare]|nr:hypothetical protein ZWY2020_010406 [Hordeum vulgare]KAI5015976.1 hypothetical protein ZWY2020_005603 [Hordeum vulgare]